MWSKLKKTVEEKFAESVKGKVGIYVTRYTSGSYFMVRGWITINGEEIANFSTPDNNLKYGWNTPPVGERIPDTARNENSAVEKGEFARWELMDACISILNLSVDDALASDNPIIRALAVLDKRCGKKRLARLDGRDEHPLVKRLLLFRKKEEGLLHSG